VKKNPFPKTLQTNKHFTHKFATRTKNPSSITPLLLLLQQDHHHHIILNISHHHTNKKGKTPIENTPPKNFQILQNQYKRERERENAKTLMGYGSMKPKTS
jgi:hypothetical protein